MIRLIKMIAGLIVRIILIYHDRRVLTCLFEFFKLLSGKYIFLPKF